MRPSWRIASLFKGATWSTFPYSISAWSYFCAWKSLLPRAKWRVLRISLVQPEPARPAKASARSSTGKYWVSFRISRLISHCWSFPFEFRAAQKIKQQEKRHQRHEEEKRTAAPMNRRVYHFRADVDTE